MIRSALLAAICLTSFQGTEEPVRPREDWIQDDLRRIELFKSTVQAEDLDVESLVAKFGSIGEHDDADAGFGVRRVHMHLYGGYTTIWIDLLGDRRTDDGKSRVVELRARQRGPAETWPAIEARYAAAWGDLAKPIEHGFEFTRRDDERVRALEKRTAEALGGSVPVVVPKDLQAAFAVLTSPLDDVVIGKHYGDGGGPPPGRREIEALSRAPDHELVRAVLRGLNPEGRLYAAWVLRQRTDTHMLPVDENAIRTLLALPQLVHTSEGCEQFWRSPKDALEFLANEK